MSRWGSSSVFAYFNGYILTLGKPKSLRVKGEGITEPSDGLGDIPETHAPTGSTRSEAELTGGFFDTQALGPHVASKAPSSSPTATLGVFCVGFCGQTVGAIFAGFAGMLQTAYEVLTTGRLLTKANAMYAASGGLEWGQILQPLATKTADWNTKTLGTTVDFAADPSQRVIPITSNSAASPSIVTCPCAHGLTTGQVILISDVVGSDADINGEQAVTVIDETRFSVAVDATTHAGTGGSFVLCSTVNGGALYQQVTDLNGLDGFVGKARDSADDTTYADLVAAADVTAGPDGQRVPVAGTVDRYLSYDGDVNGTGDVTVMAGFVRG